VRAGEGRVPARALVQTQLRQPQLDGGGAAQPPRAVEQRQRVEEDPVVGGVARRALALEVGAAPERGGELLVAEQLAQELLVVGARLLLRLLLQPLRGLAVRRFQVVVPVRNE
jgi:hypothetical protein